jgi:hypothetical protein
MKLMFSDAALAVVTAYMLLADLHCIFIPVIL